MIKYFTGLFVYIFLFNANAYADIKIRQNKDLFCYDGDTCYVEIDGKIRNDDGDLLKIRLLDLDTPEIKGAKCTKEKELALEARDFVNNLIKNSMETEVLTEFKLDKYGRVLAYLIVDEEDVSTLLVDRGLGVVYKKGYHKDWCLD
tara:strand:- start:369 stop:806 length:438 start_codon:yes stop_codon:yes gene_type:complete